MVKKGRAIDPVEAVLRSLVDGNGLQDLHQDAYHELSGLVKHTVSTGGSNSVLVLGPNNVGKTTLVNKVVKEVEDTALVVKLSGLLQTDDKLALREIAVQLNLENVVTGTQKVFGSFAQHLAFLLESLKSGGAKTSAPIVFVLDQFELFCLHHNQTLLYNLFDIAQTQAAPICVVGVSSHFDVVESLEKRVKSRFNHRQLVLLAHSNFDDYYLLVRRMLDSSHCDDSHWREALEKTLDSAHSRKLFKTVHGCNNTYGYLKQFLVTALSLLDPYQPLTFDHLTQVYTSQADPLSEKGLLQGISVLEMCVLVAVKHVLAVYPDQPAFNFEMAFHEYDKFATRKAKLFRYDRSVVMKAWEALQELELITPTDKGSKVQKEFRLFTLQVIPDQILAVVDANAPLTVKEWATSVTFQD